MKRILLPLILVTVVSCGQDRNTLMTSLVNSKKTIADSLALAHNYEGFYEDKAAEAAKEKADGSAQIEERMADSGSYYFGVQLRLRDQLKAVQFSIDSLEKMK